MSIVCLYQDMCIWSGACCRGGGGIIFYAQYYIRLSHESGESPWRTRDKEVENEGLGHERSGQKPSKWARAGTSSLSSLCGTGWRESHRPQTILDACTRALLPKTHIKPSTSTQSSSPSPQTSSQSSSYPSFLELACSPVAAASRCDLERPTRQQQQQCRATTPRRDDDNDD